MKPKRRYLYALLVAGLALVLASPSLHRAWLLRQALSHNLEARGGGEAWARLETVRYTGSMDLGADQRAAFRLEQARPQKSCFSYDFDGQVVEQCVNGSQGWAVAPYTGRPAAVALSAEELPEAAAGADPRGLLIDAQERGHRLSHGGFVDFDGRRAEIIEVELPGGARRRVFLDEETGLELKIESQRRLQGKVLRVETVYSSWSPSEGLLIPRRQATRTEGDERWFVLELRSVQVNPSLDEQRFTPPASLGLARSSAGEGR
jgi:hypothetical protein